MRGESRFTASAAVGCLVLLCASPPARAQQPAQPDGRVAVAASGSIQGIVRDEQGVPVIGAIVSALGATTAFATTDRGGKFELQTLSPGPYLVRVHLTGFVASRGQIVDVGPNGRAASSIALHRVTVASSTAALPVLAAGAGLAPASSPDSGAEPPAREAAPSPADDDHGETAWRLRHARRGILKDATLPEGLMTEDDPDTKVFGPRSFFVHGAGARGLTSFFTDTAFSGQVNLLTTGSFDSPVELFAADSFARGVAFLSVSAPAGGAADWTVRGALTQGDISSWIVAGSYTTRATARHRYDIGLSYATQRYEGGNPAALHDVTDGSRNAGAVYGFDTFAITPSVSLTYGSRFAHYDYLANRALIGPRVALTLAPTERTRINTMLSSRAVAPGAEEFLPPGDTGIWLPPQRTFSSLGGGQPLQAERATHVELELERDITAGSTLSFRAFRQHVDNQLVTVFGAQAPGRPKAELGHYFVGSSGDVDATGWSAGARAALAQRVHGSLEYSLARTRWNPAASLAYLVLVAPSTVRLQSERIHDVSATVETEVPETSTRVLVLYRVSSAFAHPVPGAPQTAGQRPSFDSRFDVQVRQSLPFLNFSTARWEMLLAVHNFFRETAPGQSLYDELLVVHPPKRVVGGLTLRF